MRSRAAWATGWSTGPRCSPTSLPRRAQRRRRVGPAHYGEARRRVVAIATWLLGQNLSAERPVVILSDNGIEHALLALAAMHVGVPVVDLAGQLADVEGLPASCAATSSCCTRAWSSPPARALPARDRGGGPCTTVSSSAAAAAKAQPGVLPIAQVEARADEGRGGHGGLRRRRPRHHRQVPVHSGSVGTPKAVINTQHMMCSNQLAKGADLALPAQQPPGGVRLAAVEPRTFGSNHDFNMVLRWGGSFDIDDGKPTPALIEDQPATCATCRRRSISACRGLRHAGVLRQDAPAQAFFRRLQVIFYAAGTAAAPVERARALSGARPSACRCPGVSVGLHRTAPLATDCHFQALRRDPVPVPGTELKLVPSHGKLEVRVRAPTSSPATGSCPSCPRSLRRGRAST